jgi:hypothetical protein
MLRASELAAMAFLVSLALSCVGSRQDSCKTGEEVDTTTVDFKIPISEPGTYEIAVKTATIETTHAVTLDGTMSQTFPDLLFSVFPVEGSSPAEIGGIQVPGTPGWVAITVSKSGGTLLAGTVYPVFVDVSPPQNGCASERAGRAAL